MLKNWGRVFGEQRAFFVRGHFKGIRTGMLVACVISMTLVGLLSGACVPFGGPRETPVLPASGTVTPTMTTGELEEPLDDTSSAEIQPQVGGHLVIALDDAILTLDPADYSHRPTETVIRNMFDGLVTRALDGRVVPEIAESYRWIDEQTLEFVLREGITFHNGEDLTAEDVVFSFERIITDYGIMYPEPHTSPRKGLIAALARVEEVDEYRVRFHFSSPSPVALQLLVHQHIIPKDYFERVGTEGFINAPIGSGPFEFVSATPLGTSEQTQIDLEDLNLATSLPLGRVELKRFADYYGGSPDLEPVGAPFLEQLTFRTISDTAERVRALQAAEVDIIQSVPSYLVPVLAADPGVNVKTAPGTRPYWMEMNVSRPPFDDVRVRQAMNYIVDANLLVATFLNGRGTVLAGPLSPYNHFVDPTLEPYTYNPFKAEQLLAEAGYKPADIAFVLDCRVGEREYAEAVAAQLRAFGMRVSVSVWDYSELRPLLLAGRRVAYLDGWGDSAFDPVGHFEAKWHTHVEGSTYGRGNYSTYSNNVVDALIKVGEVEPDIERRHRVYNEAQRIVYEEAPAVFLFVPDVVEASSARVQNWLPSSDGRLNMHDVWLKQSELGLEESEGLKESPELE